MKRFIAIISAIVIIFSTLSACGKNEPKEKNLTTTTAVTTQEASTVETSTSEKSTEKEISTEESQNAANSALGKVPVVNQSKLYDATENDKKTLTEFMAFILCSGRDYVGRDPDCGDEGYSEKDFFKLNYRDYDYVANNAFELGFLYMLGVPFYSIFDDMENIYNLKSKSFCENIRSINETPISKDPKNKFTEMGSAGYLKIEAEYFDLYMKSIFNVEPNHSYELQDENSRWFSCVSAYYYEGYYYILKSEGGGAAGYYTVIDNMAKRSDGKYDVTLTYQCEDYGGTKQLAKIKIVTGLKEIDGKRIWSLYTMKLISML